MLHYPECSTLVISGVVFLSVGVCDFLYPKFRLEYLHTVHVTIRHAGTKTVLNQAGTAFHARAANGSGSD